MRFYDFLAVFLMIQVFFVTPCCLVGDFRRSEEYDVSTFTDSRFVLRPSPFGPQD